MTELAYFELGAAAARLDRRQLARAQQLASRLPATGSAAGERSGLRRLASIESRSCYEIACSYSDGCSPVPAATPAEAIDYGTAVTALV